MKLTSDREDFLKKTESYQRSYIQKCKRMYGIMDISKIDRVRKQLSKEELSTSYDVTDIDRIFQKIEDCEKELLENLDVPMYRIEQDIANINYQTELDLLTILDSFDGVVQRLKHMLSSRYQKLPKEIKDQLDDSDSAIEDNIQIFYTLRNQNIMYHIMYAKNIYMKITKLMKKR